MPVFNTQIVINSNCQRKKLYKIYQRGKNKQRKAVMWLKKIDRV